MNTKELQKKIDALASTSPTGGGPKGVIDDLASLAFNVIADGRMVYAAGMLNTDPAACMGYRVHLDKYEGQPDAWAALQDIYMGYLAAVKASEPFADLLGTMYAAYVGKVHAQYLTPATLASAVAGFSAPTTEPTRVVDYACGGGALLLGHLRQTLAASGRAGVLSLDIHAGDIDPHMCRLTAVQVVLGSIAHGIPFGSLHVQCGDTISDYEALQDGRNTVICLTTKTA